MQEKEGKRGGGQLQHQQLHEAGVPSPGGPLHQGVHQSLGGHRSSPPRTPSDPKKCESSPLKHELYPPLGTSKLKIEPGDSPGAVGGDSCGMTDEMTARRILGPPHSPGKDIGLLPSSHGYMGKEEVGPQLLNHVHIPGMDPSGGGLQAMSEVLGGGCNNFSVDSLMTSREGGSPVDNRLTTAQLQDMSGYSHHYAPCLYPSNSSLEELSNMTAACIPQGLMAPPYSRPNWYSMPGGNSPTHHEQAYPPQTREYFDPLGKPPSPSACSQVPYRTPPYRTYYPHNPQECDKY